MTLKTGVMAAENSALDHRNKLRFKIYSNRKLNKIKLEYNYIRFKIENFQDYHASILNCIFPNLSTMEEN